MLLRLLRRLVLAAASLVGIAVVLWIARAPILTAMARFLTVEDALAPADVILMFPGEVNMRPARAAKLYGAGFAPIIVIPRSQYPADMILSMVANPADTAAKVLQRLGVPRDAVVILNKQVGSVGTRGDARIFREYVERHEVGRVLAVTSMYHSRRARWVLRRVLEGLSVKIMMIPVPAIGFREDNWWQRELGMVLYFEEYVRWLHNYFQW